MYIGQKPATTFDSGIQDRFTGLTTNTVTLNHEISAEEDILVVWNNIVQDKNTYSVGGTGNKTVTLGGTLASGDVVTVYYQNKVLQSVNPTAGSVTSTILGSDILSGQTDIGGAIADADLFLVDDGAGGTVRKTAASRLKTYIGNNTPSFRVTLSGNQSIANSTATKITFDTETWDSDNTFASNKWTPATAGKYLIVLGGRISGFTDAEEFQLYFKKNGSDLNFGQSKIVSAGTNGLFLAQQSTIIESLDDDDYIEGWTYQNTGSAADIVSTHTYMAGFKLSGV